MVTIEHKVRDLKKPAVYSINISMDLWNLLSCLLLSLFPSLSKCKFERTYQLYIRHHCALDCQLSKFLYQRIIVVDTWSFDLSEDEVIYDLGLHVFPY